MLVYAGGPPMEDASLDPFAQALDGLDVALCVFDADDRTIAWNRSFLVFFPEHDGFVHAGEPYADNLRRFYAQRLAQDERPMLERYVAEGVARHRAQRRPYEFDHRGRRLRVSSVERPDGSRVRVWREVGSAPAGSPRPAPRFDPQAGTVLERIADGVLVVDNADHVLWANRSFVELYGLAGPQDAVGRGFEALYRDAWRDTPDAEVLQASLATLRENQRFSGAPYELALPGDRWVRVVERRGDGVDGRGYFLHADITALKRQQRALRDAQARASQSEQRLQWLAEASSDATLALVDGRIVYVSPPVTRLLGWTPAELVGRPLQALCHPDDRPALLRALRRFDGNPDRDARGRLLRRDGEPVWVEARGTRPAGGNELVVNVRSIAARKAVEDQLAAALKSLETLAATDALTGLANRRRFDEALDVEWRRARRTGSTLALLLLDVDHFKGYNDRHGHPAGDRVLQQVAAAMTRVAARAGDLAARYGGEEFALVLPATSAEQAAIVGERLRAAVAAIAEMPERPIEEPVTVSIGLCASTAPGLVAESDGLLARADQALYRAKNEGRDRVVAWTPPPD